LSGVDIQSTQLERNAFYELAEQAKLCYNISSQSKFRLISCSENATFLVEEPKNNLRMLLNIRNPTFKIEELEAEAQWNIELLKNSSLIVPEPMVGIDGKFVQKLTLSEHILEYHCLMTNYVAGISLNDCDKSNIRSHYMKLGETTAILHQNAIQWNKAKSLGFRTFNPFMLKSLEQAKVESNLTDLNSQLFCKAYKVIELRLEHYSKLSRRFGLIHADLRLENLMSFNNKTVVVNFQNCVLSWYLYDCAVSLGDIDLYKTDEILSAWLDGYRRVRNIPKDDRDELPTFLLLYRLQQIYKSRTIGALKTQALCSDFYDQTVLLCEKYLKAYS